MDDFELVFVIGGFLTIFIYYVVFIFSLLHIILSVSRKTVYPLYFISSIVLLACAICAMAYNIVFYLDLLGMFHYWGSREKTFVLIAIQFTITAFEALDRYLYYVIMYLAVIHMVLLSLRYKNPYLYILAPLIAIVFAFCIPFLYYVAHFFFYFREETPYIILSVIGRVIMWGTHIVQLIVVILGLVLCVFKLKQGRQWMPLLIGTKAENFVLYSFIVVIVSFVWVLVHSLFDWKTSVYTGLWDYLSQVPFRVFPLIVVPLIFMINDVKHAPGSEQSALIT